MIDIDQVTVYVERKHIPKLLLACLIALLLGTETVEFSKDDFSDEVVKS